MKKKTFSLFFLFFFTSNILWAKDIIKITVQTNEHASAAIGYKVNGSKAGGLGKSYSGTGPKNKKYIFGFRKNSLYGKDILCGETVLTQDSIVTLKIKEDKCFFATN